MKRLIGVMNNPIDVILPLVDGQVGTNGIQYSTGVVCATGAAVEILNRLLDVGQSVSPLKIEVGLTQRFVGGNGSLMGSLIYHWQGRSEAVVPSQQEVGLFTGNYARLNATLSKGIGTLLTVEDTLSGDLNVASLPVFPIRLRLLAQGAPSITGSIKGSSYIRVIGNVIPGT